MEKHPVGAELQHSRALLRALLLPDPRSGRIEADVFPRSTVMRVLFDPGKRRAAFAGLTLLAMLAGRSRRAQTRWPMATRSLGALLAMTGKR
jgi:hypothetical protein